MYLTHGILSRELYYFWGLVFPRNLIIVKSKTNYWHILTLRNVLWIIRVVLPWKNSVKDPNKEHNFFNKNPCSWWRIANFSCHSIGASNLEFIVWRKRYRKKYIYWHIFQCIQWYENYNKVVPKNSTLNALFRISYFTGPS